MFQISTYLTLTFCDCPEPWRLFFQDNATPQMEGIEELHNSIMFYFAIILFAVSWIMLSIMLNYCKAKISNKYTNHGTLVELIWTITPALILVLIAFPFFKFLDTLDEIVNPSLVIYGEGHQWYWSYQYPVSINKYQNFVEFDSYMVPDSNLEIKKLEMIEVDNPVDIPKWVPIVFVKYYCLLLNILSDAIRCLDFWYLDFALDAGSEQELFPSADALYAKNKGSSASSSNVVPTVSKVLAEIDAEDTQRYMGFVLGDYDITCSNYLNILIRIAERELEPWQLSEFNELMTAYEKPTDKLHLDGGMNAIPLAESVKTEKVRELCHEANADFSKAVEGKKIIEQAACKIAHAKTTAYEKRQLFSHREEMDRIWGNYKMAATEHMSKLVTLDSVIANDPSNRTSTR